MKVTMSKMETSYFLLSFLDMEELHRVICSNTIGATMWGILISKKDVIQSYREGSEVNKGNKGSIEMFILENIRKIKQHLIPFYEEISKTNDFQLFRDKCKVL